MPSLGFAVLRYAFNAHNAHNAGRKEGRKDSADIMTNNEAYTSDGRSESESEEVRLLSARRESFHAKAQRLIPIRQNPV